MSLFSFLISQEFSKSCPVQFRACLDGMAAYLKDPSTKNKQKVVELLHGGVLRSFPAHLLPSWGEYSSCESFVARLVADLADGDPVSWIKIGTAALAHDYSVAASWLVALRELSPAPVTAFRPTG